MATTDRSTPALDPQADPEKAVRPSSNSGGEAARDSHSGAESILTNQPGDTVKVEDAGPPDGGTTAWLVVLGAWCCSLSSPGWINSVGGFQQYYETGPLKDYSSSTISWIVSLQIFFLFALGPFVGIAFDNYGPRPLIIVGSLLHVFGLMMASLAKTYYQFILSQGVCSAIGVACLYSPALACVTTWFSKKRGAAMGIMVTGSSLGGVIFPIMIARMVPRNGYPWTMRTAAFIILALQIVAVFTVRPRVKPVPKKMLMDRLAAPFTELPYVIMLLGFFLLTFGIFIPIVYLGVQGNQEAHMSDEMAQYVVSIFNASSLFGRLVAGFIADKIGRWNVFIMFCGLSGLAIFAVWIPAKTSSIVIGFAIMFGFVSGAFISLLAALPASVSPLPEIGYRMGVVFFAVSIPALTLAPIGGAILQNGNWLDVKIFGGVTCIIGTSLILLSRWLYTDKKFFKVF